MRSQKGFTLVELLVAMAIAGIVMAAGYSMYISQQKAYQTTEDVSALQQNMRSAMYFIEHDMRMAGYNPTRASMYCGFIGFTSSLCTFGMDTNENGAYEIAVEQYTYYLDSTNNRLMRAIGAVDASGQPVSPGQQIADNITGLSFTWYDVNGNILTNVNASASIERVEVTLTGTDGQHTRQLSSMINCRNMGL